MTRKINGDLTLRPLEREFQKSIKKLFGKVVLTRDAFVAKTKLDAIVAEAKGSQMEECDFANNFKKIINASDASGCKEKTVLFIKWTTICPSLQEKNYSNVTGLRGDLKTIFEDVKDDIEWEWHRHNWLIYMHCYRKANKNLIVL